MGFTKISWANGLFRFPYYLAGFLRDGTVVLVEHIIGEYEPWLHRTVDDAAFVAHVVQI